LLLAHVVGRPRAWLLAHDDTVLSDDESAAYRALLQRRAGGEPVAYLVGSKEFHGLTLQVRAGVLVPRPDTETLVDWAIAVLRGPLASHVAPTVVDLGTGSGAIALAIKHAVMSAHVTAVDVSADALEVASGNARRLGLSVECRHGDWWSAVGGRRFDLAVANPPYVAQDDPHLDSLQHEPRLALASGSDGLDAIRRIVADAPAALAPGAWLLLEHGYDQAEAVRGLLDAAGFAAIETRDDLAGIPRCTGGRRAPKPRRRQGRLFRARTSA
jgi:release factor glutamine methyltransferase